MDTVKGCRRLERGNHHTDTKKGTLLSKLGKIMTVILLNRIRNAVDEKLRQERTGFRPGRSCCEQIFTLRQIIEKAMINFIVFKKKFDSVHRGSLWKIMKKYVRTGDGLGDEENDKEQELRPKVDR